MLNQYLFHGRHLLSFLTIIVWVMKLKYISWILTFLTEHPYSDISIATRDFYSLWNATVAIRTDHHTPHRVSCCNIIHDSCIYFQRPLTLLFRAFCSLHNQKSTGNDRLVVSFNIILRRLPTVLISFLF